MIHEVVIATRNNGKLKEFSAMLKPLNIKVYTLDEYGNIPEIEEDGSTFAENAKKKAEFIRDYLQLPAIADDSGLVVDVLQGKPGIYSARFAGEDKDDHKNNKKLLDSLSNISKKDRTAQFVSAIALAIPNEETIIVHGYVKGIIAFKPKGANGFGYDPLFYLPEYDKTMAEIPTEFKNKISHRANALKNLTEVLEKHRLINQENI